MPDTNYVAGMGEWLKKLAEYVEFIDRREQGLREEAAWKKKTEKAGIEYEPQTYDEAIALCKGWPRAAFGYDISWEKDKWPELWKEMIEARCKGILYLDEDSWVFSFPSYLHKDVMMSAFPSFKFRGSTPGRAVCRTYICCQGHADWAERLSKDD